MACSHGCDVALSFHGRSIPGSFFRSHFSNGLSGLKSMKFSVLAAVLFLATLVAGYSQTPSQTTAGATGGNSSVVPPTTTPEVTENGPDHRIWQWQSYEITPDGQTRAHIHQVTELSTGLNHLVNGQYIESSEEIEALPQGGAEAVNAPSQAYFPGDIYQGTIRLQGPDGKLLESRPIGLCYDNGTNTVLFAELTNSVGYLADSNQVIYPIEARIIG